MEKAALLEGHRHLPPPPPPPLQLIPLSCNDVSDNNEEDMLYHTRTVREIQIASNFAVLKSSLQQRQKDEEVVIPSAAKRIKYDEKEQQNQQYNLALETAVLVQKEIEQWENSIRELELILSSHHHNTTRAEIPSPQNHRNVPDGNNNNNKSTETITVAKHNDATNTAAATNKHNRVNLNDVPPPQQQQQQQRRSISASSSITETNAVVSAVIDEDDDLLTTSLIVEKDY